MAYYLGVKQNKTQVEYTAYGTEYQVCLPMNLEIIIPSDEPVRLLNAVTEELDYRRLTATYSRLGRIEYSPRLLNQMVKLLVQWGEISLDEGILLRVNRSIQAEGVFAMIKEDMNFRRFLTRGSANVMVEWYLVSMAFNILKLHHKIQTGRLGNHLFVPGAA